MGLARRTFVKCHVNLTVDFHNRYQMAEIYIIEKINKGVRTANKFSVSN